MRVTQAIASILFLSSFLFAQDITAYTKDGKKIILHENGTWEYATQVDTSQVKPITETVYVTRTGSKYHRSYCRYLSKSKIPMQLDKAAARYDPCKVCQPPRPKG